MKKNIPIVLAATAAYSYLFYEQNPGINHLIFSVVLTCAFALSRPHVLRTGRWWLAAGAYLLSGFVTALNGTPLNLLMNLGGMGLLMYVATAPGLSIITGSFYSFLSAISGVFVSIAGYVERQVGYNPSAAQKTDEKKYKWHYVLIPLLVAVLFIFLYRNASGAFSHLVDQVDLSFISPQWVAFTFFGFLFLYGLFNPPAVFDIFKKEAERPNTLEQSPRWMSRGFNFTGITLFLLLDLLLLLVNITDLIYLFVIGKKNMHMSHSELIHQGIDALTVSVIFAVIFILIWLNQLKDQEGLYKKLKVLALIWVLLNIVLIATNTYKNYQYIAAHGLTYKRIGVYFFLTLAMLTLAFCWIKISLNKTNFFMYRRFGLALLLTCLTFNAFNWDKVIARHNIARYKTQTLKADPEYMFSLSNACLPLLLENREVINPARYPCPNERLNERCRNFMRTFGETDWRSRSWNDYTTYRYLLAHPVPAEKDSNSVCDNYNRR